MLVSFLLQKVITTFLVVLFVEPGAFWSICLVIPENKKLWISKALGICLGFWINTDFLLEVDGGKYIQ